MSTSPTSKLVLYSNAMWNSPYVLSAFVGLTEKKLPFEVREVALHEGEQRSPDYVKTSFTARVPALVDGAFTLSESSAIIEYLEDKWPAPAPPTGLQYLQNLTLISCRTRRRPHPSRPGCSWDSNRRPGSRSRRNSHGQGSLH